MIFEKMKPCLCKVKLGFRTYGLINLLGPSGPNAISSPQTPRSQFFFRFHNFVRFILLLWRK